MKNSTITIAKFTIIEAFRNKNMLFLIIGLAVLFGIAEFLSELMITENKNMLISWLTFSARLFLVVLLSLFILTSLSREFDDKIMLHIFSHSIQRYSYYMGKLIAFSILALFSVVCLALLLLIYVPFHSVLFWSVSFYFELLILIALSLLFFMTFKQTVISFVSIMAFYILARNMATIQLISDSPIIETNSLSNYFIKWIIDVIDYVLPALYDFSQGGGSPFRVRLAGLRQPAERRQEPRRA